MNEPTMQTVVVDGVTKYSISFPLTDENGQPLLDRNKQPRVTNLVADSPEELVKKLATSNLEVSRALDRSSKRFETLSSRAPTTAPPPKKIEAKPLTQDEKVQVGLDAQDPRKAADAIQRVVESVVPVKEITEEVTRQAKTLDLEGRRHVAADFIRTHPDYLPIEANNAMLNRFLIEKGWEFSVANLELAAATLADSLVRRPPPSAAPNNAPPPSSENAPPNNEPQNRGTPPTQERRAPVGGIRNSQASAAPASETTLTRQQALEMLYKEPAKYEAWMRDPVKNQILNRALNGR